MNNNKTKNNNLIKFFLWPVIFIIILIIFIIFYLNNYGIKTTKFNDLILEKINEIDNRLKAEIEDVFLKLDLNKREIIINTKNTNIYLEKNKISFLDINLNLDISSVIKNDPWVKRAEIKTKQNSIINLTNFINSYKLNIPLYIALSRIKDGTIIAEAKFNLDNNGIINPNFQISGKINRGKIKLLNNELVKNVNLNFELINNKIELNNINLNYLKTNFNSNLIKITKKNKNYKIEGDIKNKKSSINLYKLISQFNKNINFIKNEEIAIESNNNFTFLINKKRKIKNLSINSIIKFDKLLLNKKYQDLIFFENGIIKTSFFEKNLLVKIDSEYSFLDKKYSKEKDNIKINIKKDKQEDIVVETFFKNENTKLNTKQLSKYINIDKKILKDQDFIIDSNNKISFSIDKKNKINNLKINSILSFDKLKIDYISNKLKKIIPNYQNEIFLTSDSVEINYSKNKTQIDAKGKYSFKDKKDNFDNFEMQIFTINNGLNFTSSIELNNAFIKVDNINFKKKKNIFSKVNVNGSYIDDKEFKIKEIKYLEDKNKILISNLNISKNYKILNIDKFELNYLNKKNNYNFIKFYKSKNNYNLISDVFDGEFLFNNLLDSKSNHSFLRIFQNLNSEIMLSLDNFYVGNQSYLNKIVGILKIKNSKLNSANIDALLNNKTKFSFILNTSSKKEIITNIVIDKPEPFIKNYKFIKGFKGGLLSYRSIEKNGKSKSKLKISDFKIKDMPALAKLLSLVSLPSFQGISDLLTGEGISFDEFDMDYESDRKNIKINEMYSIGPSISILMNGYIEKNKLTSLRGTLVPATGLNKFISSLPLLGDILVGKKTGEGVIGVSFKIKGHPKNLKTTVNPIKTLTPRFITRTLEKLKRN